MRKAKRTHIMALLAILAAVLCSKTKPIFTKMLFEDGWTPVSVYFLSLVLSALFLAVHEFMTLEEGGRWGMTRKDLKGVVLTTATGGIISPILFFVALNMMTASEVILIGSMGPAWVVLFAVLLLGERFNTATITGSLFLLAGIGVLLWPNLGDAQANTAALLLVVSTLTGAMTTIMHKKYIKHRHLDSVVFVRTCISVVIIGAWMYYTEPKSFQLFTTPQNMFLVFGLPVVGFILPYFLYFRALHNVKAMEAGFVAGTGPILGVLLAAAFLNDSIEPHHLLSLGLIVFGIIIINAPLTKWRIVPSRLMAEGPLRR